MSQYHPLHSDRDFHKPPRSTIDEESSIGLIPSPINQETFSQDPNEKHGESKTASNKNNLIIQTPKIPKKYLILWRISIILIFIISCCLLYLLTCSNPSWRNKWSVVKVNLPPNEWTSILNQGKSIDGIVKHENVNKKDKTKRADKNEDKDKGKDDKHDKDKEEDEGGGWLSVNMWGWCLQDSGKTETICSGQNMLFDLDELLGEESKSSAPSGDDFNFLLTHGLIIHEFGMIAAMLAIIPIVWNTYRTIRAKQPVVESGWLEYGTLLTACTFCFIAYIINRLLKSSVKNNLENHKVISGQALTVTGVITILLTLTFLLSSLPPFYFHMRRQSQLVKYWEDFEEEYDDDDDQTQNQDNQNNSEKRGRRNKRRPKRSKTRRFTNMVFGVDDHDRNRKETGGMRRKGTLSRWRSRRRERRRERRDRESGRGRGRERRDRGRERDEGRDRYDSKDKEDRESRRRRRCRRKRRRNSRGY